MTETPSTIENNEQKVNTKEQNENKGKKRIYENSSPPKEKLVLEKDSSPRANFSKKSKNNNQDSIESEEVTPSPVFSTRFKSTEKSEENKVQSQNRNTLGEEKVHPNSGKDHETSCGCHDCFTGELRNVSDSSTV